MSVRCGRDKEGRGGAERDGGGSESGLSLGALSHIRGLMAASGHPASDSILNYRSTRVTDTPSALCHRHGSFT